MRRTKPIAGAIESLGRSSRSSSRSPYLCASCRAHIRSHPPSTAISEQSRNYSSRLSSTATTKRWRISNSGNSLFAQGTAYRGSAKIEQRIADTKIQREQSTQAVNPEHGGADSTQKAAAVNSSYKEATTWDGLEHVGMTGQWWEEPEREEEVFKG